VSTKLLILALASVLLLLTGPQGRATGSPRSSEPLEEVTVTARRVQLAPRLEKFVNQIAAVENGGEGLARWEVPPVCPLVSGLPEKDGEFILERLSEIARGAGIPLGDEHCRPNLYVLVTDQPVALLRGMEQRNRGFTFGYDASFYPPIETPAGVVDEFINTPRPVRVWYSSTEKDAWGKPLGYCPAIEVMPQCAGKSHSAACDPSRYYRCGSAVAGGSHLEFNTIWTFSRVFLIVDRNRLQGVQLGQLADYVAMAGFAKLKPGAHLDDAQTILKLFDAGPEAAPAGMTQWDQTFLKSLYATEPRSKLQRSSIARAMLRDLQ
jgi:hypothetical protein